MRPRDLISGAILAKIKTIAAEKACLRHIAGGAQGVQVEDFLAAAEEEMLGTARVLTPQNCRSHLDDLPQDNLVVAIEPVVHKEARVYEILRSA